MSDSSKPTNQSKKKFSGVAVLVSVLSAWALLIAVGSFQTQLSSDIRRPLVVLATMSLFLGVWMFALAKRKQRLEKDRGDQ